jgi:hypothetical protein
MAADGSDDVEACESLQATILAVVAPGSWEQIGGSGALHFVPAAQALVCVQSEGAHAELAQLLTTLRWAERQHAEQAPPAAAAGAGELRTKLYKLAPAAMTDQSTDEIARLLTSRIEPGTWSHEGAFVSAVGNRLIVRQTAAVQQQVTRLLRALELLAAPEAGSRRTDVDMSATPDTAPEGAAPAGN